MRSVFLACAILAAVVASPTAGWTAERVRCEVLTIEASRAGRGIDPALAAHAAIFKQPPLSTFDTFRLMDRRVYELGVEIPVSLVLPPSLGGSLRYNRFEAGRLDLTLTVARAGSPPLIVNGKAAPGRPFFAAGFAAGTNTLVFGVICNRGGTVDL